MAPVETGKKGRIEVRGTVFSDLGRARDFMSLEWARRAMRERLGFDPYPGTLNLRIQGSEGLAHWQAVKGDVTPVSMPSPDPSFCSSKFFMGLLARRTGSDGFEEPVAAVVPEVENYPGDKVEVIAGLSLKETYSVRDGDELVLIFERRA